MPRIKILPAALLLAPAVLLGGAALAQIPFTESKAPDPNQREVSLVQQDESDCANSSVNDHDASLIGGTAYVVRGQDGTTRVKVGLNAKPKTTYHFFIKCVKHLGDIKTSDEGQGQGEFTFPTNETGNAFAFDMFPEGAPAGNRYQSVQVKY